MFTPIKNLITYIQKNASSGSSIFGGSNTCSKKMETENLKLQSHNCINLPKTKEKQTSNANEGLPIMQESSKASIKPSAQTVATASLSTSKITSETYNISSLTRTSSRKVSAMASATAAATTIDIDDDDIEAQLDTSIMLKEPVKRAKTNDSKILEVKKSLQSKGRSICISHDFNRNYAVSLPFDDELEDFRHEPSEVAPSSPLRNQSGVENDDIVYVDDEGDNRSTCDLPTDDARIIDIATECVEDHFADCEGDEEDLILVDDKDEVEFLTDEELEAKSTTKRALESETENSEYDEIEEVHVDGVEETYIELNSFPDCEIIVISETGADQNVTPVPLDVMTSDDPLAIACEEQEAFAADRTAALEELNLLNSSNNSQDEDTQTTADEDLQWLRVDASAADENEQPSCSKSSAINNSLGSIGTTPEKEERNGEGSDSGLGSETSALHITNSSLGDNSQLNLTSPEALAPSQAPQNAQKSKCSEKDKSQIENLQDLSNNKSPLKDSPKPLRSNLKRRLDVGEDVVDSLNKIASSATSSSLVTTSSSSLSGSVQKKPKRSINFDNVQVFFFPRQQGFGCIPSAGGCTLGMGARHVAFKTLSLAEHAAELRRAHRMQLQEINPRGSSSDDSEESEEEYLSEGSGSDLDAESNGFLQPVSPKQRRAILKAAGVRKIDTSEKAECRDIRNSREVCGCSCRDFCDPETCACSQSGIKCQVDRDMFPCGCSRDACGNTIGRVEFNPARVRTHFIHTLMRLEMENRQLQNPYSPAVAVPSAVTSATVSFYQSAHLQPQSNYSSGYASPAYNSSSAAAMHSQTPVNSSFYHQQTLPTDGGLYGAGVVGVNASISQSPGVSGVTTPYGMVDSLDTGLYGSAAAGATPSYGELMPVPSYHHTINYGNVATPQVPPYNSYHSNNTVYINVADETTTTPTTYSSCAVPSLPPYGTATTTEATGNYHCVNSLRTLETTTAPSCSTVTEELLDVEGDSDGNGSSFISLSTPLASSSRLSQINDLLQHNRNATTALIAVSQSVGNTKPADKTSTSIDNEGGGGVNYQITNPSSSAISTSTTKSIDTPPIEDVHKSCLIYIDLTAPPPLRPAPIVAVVDISDASDKSPVQQDTTPTTYSPIQCEANTPTIDISSSTATTITSTSSSAMPILNSEIFSAPSTATTNLYPPTGGEKPIETTAPNVPNAADLTVMEVLAGN